MSEEFHGADWFEAFFSGAALDLWRHAISPEVTEKEIEFLREALETDVGAQLLDLPCGNGRLSVPFAKLGYKVTGVDFCLAFVEEAKECAKGNRVKIDFVKDDMRKLSYENKFDGAFCMGNSFGYFDRTGTLQFFKAVSNSLTSGAKFVLDSAMVAECFLVNGGEREWLQVGDLYMLIENNYDCKRSCVETTYTFFRDGKKETRLALHWIYTVGEICRMLEDVDVIVKDLYSSTDFDEYTLGSDRVLLVAEKR